MSVIVVLFMCMRVVNLQSVLVTVQGRLRGLSHEGYVSYMGVPYATVNDTHGRYKRAGLAPFWLGVREAPQSQCTVTSLPDECLRLDVHVPSLGSSPWPVLVWVAGGSGHYPPGKLVQRGIIVVVVYHRLGPVGFLCLNEESIPGNAGVKDVIIALRWVRDNIVAFRGNPAKVVVAGQSFGAAMVEALMLSPMATGLYHGVIMQSGTILSPWAFNYDAEDRARALANMFEDGDAETVLINAKIVDLVRNSNKLNKPYFPFGVCAEKAFKKEERLLSGSPFDLLKNKRVYSVPMIIGYNNEEAYIFASNIKHAKLIRKISNDMTFLLPDELKFFSEREVDQVSKQIGDIYFKKNLSISSVLAYHRDAYFINHIHRSARLHASSSHLPVYYYQFSYVGAAGVAPEPGVEKTGAAHSDELSYLFPETERTIDAEDGVVQERLTQLWSNFVKYLNPTTSSHDNAISWQPLSPYNVKVLNIGTGMEMTEFPHTRATEMWDAIYEKYYYSRLRTPVR